MSGFILAYSACFACGRTFAYNPRRVPSIRPALELPPEPVCRACVELANQRRKATGLPLIVPLPDAYEPLPEAEL